MKYMTVHILSGGIGAAVMWLRLQYYAKYMTPGARKTVLKWAKEPLPAWAARSTYLILCGTFTLFIVAVAEVRTFVQARFP